MRRWSIAAFVAMIAAFSLAPVPDANAQTTKRDNHWMMVGAMTAVVAFAVVDIMSMSDDDDEETGKVPSALMPTLTETRYGMAWTRLVGTSQALSLRYETPLSGRPEGIVSARFAIRF